MDSVPVRLQEGDSQIQKVRRTIPVFAQNAVV